MAELERTQGGNNHIDEPESTGITGITEEIVETVNAAIESGDIEVPSSYGYPSIQILNSGDESVELMCFQFGGSEESFYHDFNTSAQALASQLGVTIEEITDKESANTEIAKLITPLNQAGTLAIGAALKAIFAKYSTNHFAQRFGCVLDNRQAIDNPLYYCGNDEILFLDDVSSSFKSFIYIDGISGILDGTYTLASITLY